MQCIQDLKLKMNLFSVESSFAANKLTFFFTSEGRVDFRELVKRLVKELGVRIEMRQVGIRSQAKMPVLAIPQTVTPRTQTPTIPASLYWGRESLP